MAGEQVFAPPRAEEMTEVAAGLGGAIVGGIATGVIIKVAPGMGAATPILTWGALLGIPLVGAAGALFTRGMLSNLFMGVAAGGVGIIGYTVPEMLMPATARRGGGGSDRGLTEAEVKLLNPGRSAAQEAQRRTAARVGIEF